MFNMSITNDIESNQIVPKKSGRGGYRPGSGRKPGSVEKISGLTIIKQLEVTCGKTYEQQLAENYRSAVLDNDKHIIAKYDQMFLNKVIGDKTNMDITSAGERVPITFVFPIRELPDWQ